MCDLKDYLTFLEENPDLHPIIETLSSRYPVAQINEAVLDAKAGKNIKTLLVK